MSIKVGVSVCLCACVSVCIFVRLHLGGIRLSCLYCVLSYSPAHVFHSQCGGSIVCCAPQDGSLNPPGEINRKDLAQHLSDAEVRASPLGTCVACRRCRTHLLCALVCW